MEGSKHPRVSLVIGGTGMLAEATNWLAKRSDQTLVVSRTANRFAPESANIVRLELDWRTEAFRHQMIKALERHPRITDALLWVHDEKIMVWLLPLLSGARVVLLLGCLDGDPDVPRDATSVVTVRLGSKYEGPTTRRWLTHEEISGGAIEALATGLSQILGELKPV